MKKWQKERNYRKIQNPDDTCRYVITIDGEDIEVNVDVYKAYSQSDRRERYLYERESGLILSIDQMDEEGMQRHLPKTESAEYVFMRSQERAKLLEAIKPLSSDEQELIRRLFFDGMTEKQYADSIGLSQVAVHKRKKKIFSRIIEKTGY